MASASIIARPGKGAFHTLYLLIVQREHPAYASLGIKIHPRDWHADNRSVRKTHPHHAVINTRLRETLHIAEAVALEQPFSDAKTIKNEILNRLIPASARAPRGPSPDTCFLCYFETHLERMEAQDQVGTAKNQRTQLLKFKRFLKETYGKDTLLWVDFTPAVVRDFDSYLISVEKNNRTTATKVQEIVRSVLRQAINVDRLMSRDDDPFLGFKLRREKGSKLALTREQVQQIESVPLEPGSLIAEVRAWWLFAFFAGGIRFSDIAFLQYQHLREDRQGWILAWRQQKTGDHVAVPLYEPAQRILDAHAPDWRSLARKSNAGLVFDIMRGYDLSTEQSRFDARGARNAMVNKYLKKLAERAEVPAFSFHSARDSYVTYIMSHTKAGLYDAKDAVGHSKASTTEGYIRSLPITRLRDRLGDPFAGWALR